MHLLFNMYTFYMFGGMVETAFEEIFGTSGKVFYVILYLSSLVICLLPTYLRHVGDYYYRSLGASGAVSAVIFVGIFLYPAMPLQIFPIPIGIPAFIFGPLYLLLSAYLAKRGHGKHQSFRAYLGCVVWDCVPGDCLPVLYAFQAGREFYFGCEELFKQVSNNAFFVVGLILNRLSKRCPTYPNDPAVGFYHPNFFFNLYAIVCCR